MKEKDTLSVSDLCCQLEQIHSIMIAVTAALENGCGRYEPEELVPALRDLTDRLYELGQEIKEAGEGTDVKEPILEE